MSEDSRNQEIEEAGAGDENAVAEPVDETGATVDEGVDAAGGEPVETRARGERPSLLSGLVPKLAIVVAIVASLIAGSLWWQYRQFYVELTNDDTALRDNLEDTRAGLRGLDDEIQALETGLSADRARIDALSEDLQALPAEIRALGRRVEALQGGQVDARDNWLREQAEYYLVLANTELGVAGRVASAITALELADDVLRDLGDPALTDVRNAIAEELQDLRALGVPDLEGLAAQLGGLIARVPDLPMRAAAPQNFAAAGESLEDVEPGLGRLWERTKAAVTSIVRIERQEEPVGVVLTESERRIVRRQLALELQLARTAVVERRQDALRASLVAADSILNQEFDRTAQSIVETRRLLASMMQIELRPALPDIGDSLTLLRTSPGGD